jgi:hypothetical protein
MRRVWDRGVACGSVKEVREVGECAWGRRLGRVGEGELIQKENMCSRATKKVEKDSLAQRARVICERVGLIAMTRKVGMHCPF